MSKIQKRTYKKAFKPQNQMVLYKRPKYVSLTNPPTKAIRPEKKNRDSSGSTGNIGTSTWSELDYLNLIGAGTNEQERIGRLIQMKSIQIRWYTATQTSGQDVRILVIYDKSPQGALPSIGEILAVDNYNTTMNLDNASRFIILHDEINHPITSSSLGTGLAQRSGNIYKKINLPVTYGTTSGEITSTKEGAVYIMSCALSGGPGSGIGYYCRIRYTDV